MRNQRNLISAAVPIVAPHSSSFLRKWNFYLLPTFHKTRTLTHFRTTQTYCEVFHSVHSSILQSNTHYIFLHIFFTKSLLYASVCLYAILWDNFAYLLKIVSFLQGYYFRCVIKYKIYFILYNTSSVITW